MQLEDIQEENNKFLKVTKKEQESPVTMLSPVSDTASQNDSLSVHKTDHRRGSNLLAAAGIDFERRRSQNTSSGAGGSRIFQDGDQWLEEKDGKITKLEILEVKEKMGNMRRAVPTLPVVVGILLCLLNVILPGAGTFVGAGSLLCCGKCRHEKRSTGIKYGIIAGVLQVLLTPLLVGWIFSIYYGVNIVQDSMSKAAYEKSDETGGEPTPGNDDVEAAATADS